MLRKLLAGLGLGALAALIVLGLAASTDLLDRLELTTYDWRMRLAADPAAGQQGHRPRRDQRRQHPRAWRRRSAAGRGRGWRCRSASTSCSAAPAKVVAVDLQLHRARPRRAVRLRRSRRRTGAAAQSERALADSVEERGQRRHARRRGLRGASSAATRTRRARRGTGSPFHAGAAGGAAPARPAAVPGAHRRRRGARPQLPDVATTTARRGGCRRSSSATASSCRRSASPRRCCAGGSSPRTSAPRTTILRDRRSPRAAGASGRVGGHDQWTMLINYRAPALVQNAAGELETPYPSYEFRRAVRRRSRSILDGREAAARSGDLQGQDRLHRPDGVGAARRVRHADVERAERLDAGHPAAREHGRQHPGEPVHPPGVGALADRRDRSIAALAIGHAGGVPAVCGRGRRVARDPRRLDLVHRRARSRPACG